MMNQASEEKIIIEDIIKTITWYNIFYFPLTAVELWEYSRHKCELIDFLTALNNSRLSNFIESHNGFYFLQGRRDLVKLREERYNITDRKMKRAVRMTKIFKIFPWVKMVAVGNIMGAHNMREEGDIDLFIVTQKNRIWVTRFFLVSIVKFLGMRPKLGNLRDKICLSFFIDEDSMDISKFALSDGRDFYLKYWLANLVPVYNRDSIYQKLLLENNWLRDLMPNWSGYFISHRRNAGSPLIISAKIIELMFGWLEKISKRFQLMVLASELKSLMNKDSRVIINDKVLKLIPNDRRKEYRDEYLHKVCNINK